MASSGGDCCGTCQFNSINRDDRLTPIWQDRSFFCAVRQIGIESPFWTFCFNHQRRNPLLVQRPRGPLWAAVSPDLPRVALSETIYLAPEITPPRDGGKRPRVPYFDGVRPLDSDRGTCAVCNVETERTIALRLGQDRVCFCSVAHYLQWWLQHAPSAEPYRQRRPVSWEAIYEDLSALANELGQLAVGSDLVLDEERTWSVLAGLEGALIQTGHGYLDLAQVAAHLQSSQEPRIYSPELLRVLLTMADTARALRESPVNARRVRAQLRSIERLLRAYLSGSRRARRRGRGQGA